MKIAMIGESLGVPSGFGVQSRMIAEGLAKRKHEVVVIGTPSVPLKDPVDNLTEIRCEQINDLEAVDRILHRIKPDAVICFYYMGMCAHWSKLSSAPPNCPMYFWMPWEASSPEHDLDLLLKTIPEDHIVHLTKYGQQLWEGVFQSKNIIPHGVDLSIFKPRNVSQSALRREWAEKLRFPLFEDSLIVLNVDRNVWHKRWDATFDFIRRLQETESRTVQLIAHTRIHEKGEHGHPKGYNLPKLEALYGLTGKVCYTHFEWATGLDRQTLAKLYRVADLRISTSMGEGFGVPTIEAMGIGLPQIVNKQTTMPDILGEDCPYMVEPAFTQEQSGHLWQVPDVMAMVDRARYLIEDPKVVKAERTKHRRRVQKFDSEKVVDAWEELLKKGRRSNPPEQCWRFHRWGYGAKHFNMDKLKATAKVVSRLGRLPKTLVVGAFDGRMLEFCLDAGCDVFGIEYDAEVVKTAAAIIRDSIKVITDADPWPDAEVAVVTDELYRTNDAEALLDKLSEYEWVVLRNRRIFLWDRDELDVDSLMKYFRTQGMTRRHDLEKMAREKIDDEFDHEIWQRGQDTSKIPHAFAKA